MIYLDNAATTLHKPRTVVRAAAKAMHTMASPGRGGHSPAMAAAQVVFACREEAAALFDAETPEQVVFTHNATHALNIAIRTLVGPGDKVLISGYEHNAATRPLHALGAEVLVAAGPLFEPDLLLARLDTLLTSEVKAVICTHVSNVFGYLLPVETIATLCRERGIPFVLDASQSAGCLPVHLRELGAAFIAMPGHKGLYGPQGTGLLLCGMEPAPLLQGGTGSNSLLQEMPPFLPDRAEAGTPNVAGIAGLLEGIRYVRRVGTTSILRHEQQLTRATALELAELPGVTVYQDPTSSVQAGVLSFCVKDMDCEEIGAFLGERGIAVRAGLHCAPLAHSTAGTLPHGTIRASFSNFNTKSDGKRLVQEMGRILAKSRS